MTVSELIAALKSMRGDAEVVFYQDGICNFLPFKGPLAVVMNDDGVDGYSVPAAKTPVEVVAFGFSGLADVCADDE